MKKFILVLMLLNGLFFISNIYVLGNTVAAIKMHDDLPRDASALLANAKVLVCFFTGIFYVITVIAIIKKRYLWALAGVIGSTMFVGLYIIEFMAAKNIHIGMLIGFLIFGILSIIYGIFSWYYWHSQIKI